jgi:predicted amidophosphoribosyltransferase
LKYGRRRAAVAWTGAALAEAVHLAWPGALAGAVVTWVPASTARRRGRGFDQSEVVARAAARHLGLPTVRLLARRPGPEQTGASRAERLVGPALAPVGRRRGPVLLVDDVLTTGSTLRAAAAVLRRAGSGPVRAAVIARSDRFHAAPAQVGGPGSRKR